MGQFLCSLFVFLLKIILQIFYLEKGLFKVAYFNFVGDDFIILV